MCRLRNPPPRSTNAATALLFRGHPDEVLPGILVRPLQAVAEDHQELNLGQACPRQRADVDREMGNHSRGVEHRLQPFLHMARLVGLVAQEDQGMRTLVRRGGRMTAKGGHRDGHLTVHMLDVLRGRIVIRHPDQVIGGNANLFQEIGAGPALEIW